MHQHAPRGSFRLVGVLLKNFCRTPGARAWRERSRDLQLLITFTFTRLRSGTVARINIFRRLTHSCFALLDYDDGCEVRERERLPSYRHRILNSLQTEAVLVKSKMDRMKSGVSFLLVASLLALFVLVLSAPGIHAWEWCFKCPTDEKYDAACLRSAIPPWPICLAHNAEYFVRNAKESASRCCGDDIRQCRCPKKDTVTFQNKIGEWCAGVASCTAGNDDNEEADWSDVEATAEE